MFSKEEISIFSMKIFFLNNINFINMLIIVMNFTNITTTNKTILFMM
jgi:hypothetical protein